VKKFARIACAGLLAALAAPACHRDIGDDCQTSVDCDPNGTRACDLSQPGGYCTIIGCDERSCPSSSACIRSFPVQYLSTPCNPTCEDVGPCQLGPCDADAGAPDGGNCLPPCPAGCAAGSTNDCTADQLCLDVGVCAQRSFEQRACAKTCSDNGDCRGGYECRLAGTHGSMLLSVHPGDTAHFCAPQASP
jgi:hypothetical protein